jgi:hypothetical protein
MELRPLKEILILRFQSEYCTYKVTVFNGRPN